MLAILGNAVPGVLGDPVSERSKSIMLGTPRSSVYGVFEHDQDEDLGSLSSSGAN